MPIYHQEIDTSGLLCPLPLASAKRALQALAAEQILRVVSTDPSSVIDFTVFTATQGHVLLDSYQENQRYIFLIQKCR